jgi:hypothetical protein
MTLRRNPQVEVAPLKEELLLFNAAANKFFVMNASAAFLWEQLHEPAAEDALAEKMCASFSGVGSEQARADVRATVQKMVELGLLIDEGAGGKAGLDS